MLACPLSSAHPIHTTPITQVTETLFNRGNPTLLKLVDRHLGLGKGKSLFRSVTVDWSLVRQLSLDASKSSPSASRARASRAHKFRTDTALFQYVHEDTDDTDDDTDEAREQLKLRRRAESKRKQRDYSRGSIASDHREQASKTIVPPPPRQQGLVLLALLCRCVPPPSRVLVLFACMTSAE